MFSFSRKGEGSEVIVPAMVPHAGGAIQGKPKEGI
jgi:hypothetical protein